MTHLSIASGGRVLGRLFLVALTISLSTVCFGQTNKTKTGVDDQPIFHEYRGVQLGLLADEVRKKLGSPADKGDEQDLYAFGEKEQAQIYYDKAKRKVTAISVDFFNGAQGAPTPQQVFGSEIEAKEDGSQHKLVRYPKAGYWVSYSRTAGNSPIITVTIQLLPPGQ